LEVLSEGRGEEAGTSAAEWDDKLNLDGVEHACQDFLVSENDSVIAHSVAQRTHGSVCASRWAHKGLICLGLVMKRRGRLNAMTERAPLRRIGKRL